MKNTVKTNFDFLASVDKELFEIILDAQKLFQDEYFNQCIVQLRIFGETTAKRLLGGVSDGMTFDDTINCLKDKIKNETEKEFIDDLFFLKREGNKCAHGEDTTSTTALEAFERTFEIAISYANAKKGTKEFNSLNFDKTLLITGREQKDIPLIDKYLQAAQSSKEELLNSKQGEFNSKVGQDENGFKDKNKIVDIGQYKTPQKKGRKKKELTPEEQKVKEKVKAKVKEAKKNLKENINFENNKEKVKKERKKTSKPKNKKKNNFEALRAFLFIIFLICCIALLCKMIFVF